MISNMTRINVFVSLCLALVAGSCATTTDRLLEMETSQVQLRSVQTRAFDTPDRLVALRAVVATLQDLGFMIERADATVGVVSATKTDIQMGAVSPLKMTVTVRTRSETQVLVRASAEFRLKMIKDPKPYQQFFTALEKAMFLDAHEVE